MSDFLQLHLLIAYPPSNPNRDDLGRPKTAIIGGTVRQRISSQAIKRAVRKLSVEFRSFGDQLGQRTQRIGETIVEDLTKQGASERQATSIARQIASAFGALDKGHEYRLAQLVFLSKEERDAALAWAQRAYNGEKLPSRQELAKSILRNNDTAIDIAMFGRMLAGEKGDEKGQDGEEGADSDQSRKKKAEKLKVTMFNRDAAVQVAHAFTTNAVEIEDDYYTAVDDLKKPDEDAGAGFVGEAGFGAGVYYLYVCVDRDLLIENLGGDAALAARGLEALVRALATASPSGKRNSFANHVRPHFILAERGERQPRSLASAFIDPVGPGDQIDTSIKRLGQQRKDFAAAYGRDWSDEKTLHVGDTNSATLDDIARFAAAGLTAPAP